MENTNKVVYPVGARIRVRGRYGQIAGVLKVAGEVVYGVEFDGDIVYKPTKKNPLASVQKTRQIPHTEITELLGMWGDEHAVTVSAEIFLALAHSDGYRELPTASSWYESGNRYSRGKRVKDVSAGIAIPPPVFWESRYWMSEGAGCDHRGERGFYSPFTIYPLILRAEYTGELRTPSRLFEGYGGWLVTCDAGEFVTEDKPLVVKPDTVCYCDCELEWDQHRVDADAKKAGKGKRASKQSVAEKSDTVQQVQLL